MQWYGRVDAAQASGREASQEVGALRRLVRKVIAVRWRLHRRTFRMGLADTASWFNTILADQSLASELESWLGGKLNTISDVYTIAMDEKFLASQRLATAMSADVHRLVDNGHTLPSAFDAVCKALPNDNMGQELAGLFRGLSSDFCSTMGLPIRQWSEPDLAAHLELATGLFGLFRAWVLDKETFNLAEFFGAGVAVVALVFRWSETEQREFARLSGSLLVSSVIAANPVLLLVGIVALAEACRRQGSGAEASGMLAQVAGGGIVSGALLGASTLLGPAIMIAMIVALCVARLRTGNDLAAPVADVIASLATILRAQIMDTTVVAWRHHRRVAPSWPMA